MPNDPEIIIDVDAETEKVDKKIDKVLKEYSKKKIELDLQLRDQANIKKQLVELQTLMNKLKTTTPEMHEQFDKLSNSLKNSVSNIFILREQLNSLSKEYRTLYSELQKVSNASQLGNIKNSFSNFGKILSNISSSVSNTFGRITSSFKNFNFHAINSSRHVDYFGRRIFNLLRNAFVFNVISRQFRGLSTLLGNLVNRDIYFAKSLMIVKANLVRAFAPIWQIILPWIRALGDGLVWISNQLIRFINFLTGSKIKPLQGFQEAKQVVDDFNRIASPTKDLFDLKDPNEQARKLKKSIKDTQDESYRASKNAERLAKRLNNSQKQTTKLLAKFDKLEVLKFKKTKDPLGLSELSDPNKLGKNKGLDIPINFPSIEDQISNAINNIKDKPLDFYVNDNIDEQITSQVNGLKLPPLDFKVSEESQESVDNFKKKLLNLWSTIEPLAKAISKFFVELVKSFGRLFVDEDGKENKTLKTIVNGFTNFFNLISDNKNNMDTLRNFIIGLGIALITYKIAKMVVDITTTFTALFELLAGAFSLSNPVGWAALAVGCLYLIVKHWGGVKKAVEDVWDKMKEFGNWIKYKFTELWDWLKRNFIDPIANAFGKIGSWFNSKFGWHSGSYSGGNLYSVPGLAQGSVLKGGDPFLAYLNDQPRGQTNVEAPLSTIVDAFKQALSESDYNSQPEININASGDMSSFVRMLNFKLQDNKKILGNAFINDINF